MQLTQTCRAPRDADDPAAVVAGGAYDTFAASSPLLPRATSTAARGPLRLSSASSSVAAGRAPPERKQLRSCDGRRGPGELKARSGYDAMREHARGARGGCSVGRALPRPRRQGTPELSQVVSIFSSSARDASCSGNSSLGRRGVVCVATAVVTGLPQRGKQFCRLGTLSAPMPALVHLRLQSPLGESGRKIAVRHGQGSIPI